MIYFQLFLSFLKIGFTSFGGLSMVPLITDEMLSHGWMSAAQVSDIVAIAEMTPGPLGLNCSTFAGMEAAGIPGALASCLGILMPSLTVGVLAAIFFERFKSSILVEHMMVGVRPACVGMIFGVVVSLSLENYVTAAGALNVFSLGIAALDLVLLLRAKLPVPVVLGLSALLGIFLFGVLKIPM